MEKRYKIFMGTMFFIILAWVAYLFAVQITDPFKFEEERAIRYTPSKKLDIQERGAIYDRNNELLVRTVRYYQIDYDRSVLPAETRVEDCKNVARIISNNSSLSHRTVSARMLKEPLEGSVYIGEWVKENERRKIEIELKNDKRYDKGLTTVFQRQNRLYPQNNIAARVLGTVTVKSDNGRNSLTQLTGINGIEKTYDDELKGVYGWRKTLLDAWNKPVFIPNLEEQSVTDGNDLVLTIDIRVQEIVEMNLKKGLKTYGAKNAIAILMNPKTGEIISMASISADEKESSAEVRSRSNLAVSFLFEPGSTMKPFTALAALEKKQYKTTDVIDCRTYRMPARTIRDAHPFDDLSFRDVIVQSSNVGTSKIAEQVGTEKLYSTLTSFGFGTRTGSDVAGESAGILRKLKDWQGFSLHSISFGQEISVTPLQLINSYAALANGGILMKPYIVKEVIDKNKKIISQTKPTRIRKISQKASLDTLQTILQDVVEYGTATATSLPYLSIAGKTGTAEKQALGTSGYAKNKYISNFAGYFPVEDPQIVGVIIYDEPSYKYRYASESAVVTFRDITEQILSLPNYQIVPLVKNRYKEFIKIPDVTGEKVRDAEEILRKKGISYQIANIEGRDLDMLVVVNQFPKHYSELESTKEIILVVNDAYSKKEDSDNQDEKRKEMPLLVGLTIRRAVQKAKKNNVKLVIRGTGTVIEQSVRAGTKVNFGDECVVSAK